MPEIRATAIFMLPSMATARGDSLNANLTTGEGWCNINNSGVIQAWAERWRK